MMKNSLPTLYHRGKTGAIIEWRIWTEGNIVFREWGQIGGAKQIAKHICEAKNVGRANATTPEEQAIFEAKSLWQYQRDRKYRESPEEAEETIFLPMLARSKTLQFGKEKLLKFPVSVQPKFDGVRCLAYRENGQIQLISRNGKPWNVPHIVKQLDTVLPEGSVLDGELYVHGVGFQTVTSWVKRLQPDTKKVCYHVYDCPEFEGVTEENWITRWNNLGRIFIATPVLANVLVTPTFTEVDSYTQIKRIVSLFVEQGFEGGIVRLHDGVYKYGERSNYLLKVKDFLDEEFEVVSFCTGVAGTKEEKAVIWICKTKNGKEFKVRPSGSIEDREKVYKDVLNNNKRYIGRLYKVKYFENTDDGLPRFPVGLGFRDKMDI